MEKNKREVDEGKKAMDQGSVLLEESDATTRVKRLRAKSRKRIDCMGLFKSSRK